MSTKRETTVVDEVDANRDPITGEPGAHPVGVGIGAVAGGAMAGAAAGVVGGPVGTVVGAAVGAVVGGLAGKGVAEEIDPTEEAVYWRTNYTSRPYYQQNDKFEDYEPAYRYGWESSSKHAGRSWTEIESDLSRNWDTARGNSSLGWDRAKHATRDAWERVTHVGDDAGHPRVSKSS